MPIQGLQYTIPSGTETHQSFQSTGSFVVYNPNDGVCLVALDRQATLTSWDHKIPSQSGGKFPGPVNTYLSIFYLDQSGSGASGQVVIYPSRDYVDIPYFWSIGRALQSQVTSLDIQQGTQPGNPGAGITRIWSDTNGNVFRLLNTGANAELIDTSNFGTLVTLGGDLNGPVNNGHVNLVNGSAIQSRDSGGTTQSLLLMNGNFVDMSVSGGVQWRVLNQARSVAEFTVDNSGNCYANGNLQVAGELFAGSTNLTAQAGDISAYRGSNQGALYLGRTTAYLYYDGTTFNLNGPLSVAGIINANANYIETGAAFLGTATGATTAQMMLAASNVPSVYGVRMWDAVTLAQTNVANAIPGLTNPMGLLVVGNLSTGQGALFWLMGAAQFVYLGISFTGAGFSATVNNANTVNVYWDGTKYAIQNMNASTYTLRSFFLQLT